MKKSPTGGGEGGGGGKERKRPLRTERDIDYQTGQAWLGTSCLPWEREAFWGQAGWWSGKSPSGRL